MRVHIIEIKGKKIGYKIRWTEDGKPKEGFRKEYKDAADDLGVHRCPLHHEK